jgi:hypothetical protein
LPVLVGPRIATRREPSRSMAMTERCGRDGLRASAIVPDRRRLVSAAAIGHGERRSGARIDKVACRRRKASLGKLR